MRVPLDETNSCVRPDVPCVVPDRTNRAELVRFDPYCGVASAQLNVIPTVGDWGDG
jgi:hypothetical protein